jgi:hypothetical protein
VPVPALAAQEALGRVLGPVALLGSARPVQALLEPVYRLLVVVQPGYQPVIPVSPEAFLDVDKPVQVFLELVHHLAESARLGCRLANQEPDRPDALPGAEGLAGCGPPYDHVCHVRPGSRGQTGLELQPELELWLELRLASHGVCQPEFQYGLAGEDG